MKNKIAFIHRYGLEGWICCGGHAIPGTIKALSKETEVHFFGPRTTEPINIELRKNVIIHELPYTWDRACPTDKFRKTILWYLWLPIIGLKCRIMGMRMIWNDETVPLTAPILLLFFGKNTAITVMDFFMRIYTEKHPRLQWLCKLVERIDLFAWKRLSLIFTKVLYTQQYLAEHGVPKEIMHLYRNPVDHTIFHPISEKERKRTRHIYGFTDSDIVLSHHGILHPNKGNDWILRRISELKKDIPNLKYLLIGNGPEKKHLTKLAAQLNIADRIVFAGWIPSEHDLNLALNAADIGLVMRIGQETDNFHMTDTLAHEMACGKPVLAVNLHGIAEIIKNGENGFLFSPEKPKEFHMGIKKLAITTDLREKIGERLLQLSRDLTDIDIAAKKLHKIMQSTTEFA